MGRVCAHIDRSIDPENRSTEICRQRDRKFDLYQIGTDAAEGEIDGLDVEIAAECTAAQAEGADDCCAAAEERIEDEVAFVGGGEEDAFEEGDGLLGGVLAVALFGFVWREDGPDGFHLFAAGNFFHVLVIEFVAGLFIARGPDDGFGGVGEIAAGKIGRRIGFLPGDVVEDLEAELLHGEADGMDDVAGAADPDGAVGFEDALAGGEPGAVEVVIVSFRAPRGDLSQSPLLTLTMRPAWQVMPLFERK